ncbi:MAG: hypothetical protein ACLP5H_07795 [Desulfomonilaceae bacterium]
MQGALTGWKPSVARSTPVAIGTKKFLRGVVLPGYLELTQLWEECWKTLLDELCDPQQIDPFKKSETQLRYFVHNLIWQPIGKRHVEMPISLRGPSHGFRTSRECYKPLKQKSEHIEPGYAEPQTKTREYPARFQEQLDFLKGLKEGWGEGDELAPMRATVQIALQIEHRIRRKIEEVGQRVVYPELVPGVRGQIELAYITKTAKGLRKDLLIQVPRNPKLDEILILRGVRNKRGEVTKVQTVSMKSTGATDPHVEWFLDSRLP